MLYLIPIIAMLYLILLIAMLYLIPIIAMLYLILLIVMLYLTSIIAMLYLTLIFALLHLTRDILHRYSHRHLARYTWYMIYDTGTQYLHRHSVLIPTLAMLYSPLDMWHRYLTCYIYHLIYITRYLPWYTWHLTSVLPDIFMIIMWPDIWHSCISCTPVSPELLYSWTPEIGRLLTLLLILYSWYYTPVNSCSWIIMIILYTLVDIIFGQHI